MIGEELDRHSNETPLGSRCEGSWKAASPFVLERGWRRKEAWDAMIDVVAITNPLRSGR